MRTVRRVVGNERGSMVVMVAITLLAMLALSAFAIDLASLRDARAESQRTADAIALAGATAFRDLPAADAATSAEARDRAYEVAQLNKVRFDTLNVKDSTWVENSYAWGKVWVSESQDVTLNVIPDSQKVRAWVRRKGIRTYFAKLLAFPFGHVETRATAWVINRGPRVNCLKPFVMPDMWSESDTITQDVNRNHYMDPNTVPVAGNGQDGESWKYQPASIGGDDYYEPYNPDVTPDPLHPQTGYGSALRGDLPGGYQGDIGLPILLKPQTGNGNSQPTAERMGNAFWLLNLDTLKNFKEEVGGCGSAGIGDSVPYDKGSKTAVRQAIDDLIKDDKDAYWDQATQQVVGSRFANWTDSPRVAIVALIDPKFWIANSSNDKPDPGSTFTNFVRIFFEPVARNGQPTDIHARYIGPAPGGLGGPTGGPLVKVLQLIE
jgi:hypothetical protein